MKTIRNGVFETNSSSMHSITFSESIPKPSSYEDYKELTIYGNGDYGWSGPVCDDPVSKGDYILVAYAMVEDDEEEYASARNNLIDYFKERGIKLNLPEELSHITGDIDHQSAPYEEDDCRILTQFVYYPEQFFNFIFNEKTNIVIDNDNH